MTTTTDREPDRESGSLALKALACLDLTNLDDGCTAADIEALCARAVTPHGSVAAVCIWPRFVAQGSRLLAGTGVRVATVVNFPGGDQPLDATVAETAQAVADGADEIDMVIPWHSVADDGAEVSRQVAAVREAAGGRTLKTILETGELSDPALVRKACDLALEAGADFLKTSTGKVKVNATPEAAGILLSAIRDHGGAAGFKAAGGIRTPEVAAGYLALADRIMGEGWAGPQTFRFGASGLLDTLLAALGGGEAGQAEAGKTKSGKAQSGQAKASPAEGY